MTPTPIAFRFASLGVMVPLELPQLPSILDGSFYFPFVSVKGLWQNRKIDQFVNRSPYIPDDFHHS
ncbi:hypothetical protein J0895_20640 [Phormidium pseudopriestleyi FRX01]|uniref:Uncharacterized protein n=1 Tax=Phormidium pseudopriestleyi FRX01 TaxID=1759528 RepID=A0ABS3FWG6_9CYAN|nr:hypothetical protein [Phormidium pseudopriestleyi]MBO0351441.1 hypothetical protein [Phormidium pseudopriestleyi FRX01]